VVQVQSTTTAPRGPSPPVTTETSAFGTWRLAALPRSCLTPTMRLFRPWTYPSESSPPVGVDREGVSELDVSPLDERSAVSAGDESEILEMSYDRERKASYSNATSTSERETPAISNAESAKCAPYIAVKSGHSRDGRAGAGPAPLLQPARRTGRCQQPPARPVAATITAAAASVSRQQSSRRNEEEIIRDCW
jgi:hypothetical protein